MKRTHVNKELLLNYTDAKAIVKGTERCMKKNLQDYCRTEKISTVISGAKAKGIRFLYTATGTDIKQKGETLALRCGGKRNARPALRRQVLCGAVCHPCRGSGGKPQDV